MDFDAAKNAALGKKDLSKKGCFDREIVPLIRLINSMHDFYTTSSCAGRILLLKQPASGRKNDAEWLYCTHQKAEPKDLLAALRTPPSELVWFRQEPFILHISARNLAAADSMVNAARVSGLKHSGILSIRSRIMIEVNGIEHMDFPISQDSRLLLPVSYLKLAVNMANQKLANNLLRMQRFREQLEKTLN